MVIRRSLPEPNLDADPRFGREGPSSSADHSVTRNDGPDVDGHRFYAGTMKQGASRTQAPNLVRSTTFHSHCTYTQYGAATNAVRQRLRARGREARRCLQVMRPHGDLELPGDRPPRPAHGHTRRTHSGSPLSELPSQECRGTGRQFDTSSANEQALKGIAATRLQESMPICLLRSAVAADRSMEFPESTRELGVDLSPKASLFVVTTGCRLPAASHAGASSQRQFVNE